MGIFDSFRPLILPNAARPIWATCPRGHVGAYYRRRDGAIYCNRRDCDVIFYPNAVEYFASLPTLREAA